ncbi:hypothetical protein CERZMDRAFT_84242 [Cercospora zeae-maydis SCOH1-5]|uniref:Uncharacterized protein n=1 Tax=Cercospora zeae-maydis SCOH1-5 TaxID=717836 RepID=A0A6A6FH06_9PEZI|nr:hypothetical protein CERZMDRAFT_84242 [Cercospora zeae-maydis SCOH1-5]
MAPATASGHGATQTFITSTLEFRICAKGLAAFRASPHSHSSSSSSSSSGTSARPAQHIPPRPRPPGTGSGFTNTLRLDDLHPVSLSTSAASGARRRRGVLAGSELALCHWPALPPAMIAVGTSQPMPAPHHLLGQHVVHGDKGLEGTLGTPRTMLHRGQMDMFRHRVCTTTGSMATSAKCTPAEAPAAMTTAATFCFYSRPADHGRQIG